MTNWTPSSCERQVPTYCPIILSSIHSIPINMYGVSLPLWHDVMCVFSCHYLPAPVVEGKQTVNITSQGE